MKKYLFFILIILLLISASPQGAAAHKPSDSYLKLVVESELISGQLDLSVRDLDYRFKLDENDDLKVTWKELVNKNNIITSYIIQELNLTQSKEKCLIKIKDMLIDRHLDENYAVFPLAISCPSESAYESQIKTLEINYNIFFEVDPFHRSILSFTNNGVTSLNVISPTNKQISYDLENPAANSLAVIEFFKQGVIHIWIGYDHILFLVSLLIGTIIDSMFFCKQKNMASREITIRIIKIVTSFTVAHSITLALAALGYISIPSSIVESAIALSVAIVALDNFLHYFSDNRKVAITFLFGLIHGFGFAGVLGELAISQKTFVLSLISFNLGVEIGQITIVAFLMPVLYYFRDYRIVKHGIFQLGSAVIIALALFWFYERAFLIS